MTLSFCFVDLIKDIEDVNQPVYEKTDTDTNHVNEAVQPPYALYDLSLLLKPGFHYPS